MAKRQRLVLRTNRTQERALAMHRHRFPLLCGLFIAVASTLLAASVLILGKSHTFNPDRDSITPDLSVRLGCPGVSRPADDFWEHHFAKLGFRPLNPPALAKANGIKYPLSGQYIWGIDARDRILQVSAPNTPYGLVDIDLQSPPPTVHDQQLEARILEVADQAQCNVQSVRMGANKPEARSIYYDFLDTTKGWYAQADLLEHH